MRDRWQGIMNRLGRNQERPGEGSPSAQISDASPATDILDQYEATAPSVQNALNIFEGEWASKLPGTDLQAGSITLFDDYRIKWFAEHLGGFHDKDVLELGPLEAGHTYMLEGLGAASILSIEANRRAFLKCLIIKEAFQLKRAIFRCGDCVEFLLTADRQFDVCLASGVLYHMVNPVQLIALLARTVNHVCLWTHYYDPDIFHPLNSQETEYDGFSHVLYYSPYGGELSSNGFCGGSRPYSNWMTRDDIVGAFEFFGLTEITIGIEEPHHQNGPAVTLVASRPSGTD